MLDFIKFMLDGSIFKGIVLIIIVALFCDCLEAFFNLIPNTIKAFKKEINNFYVSEKNIDEKFIKKIKEAVNNKKSKEEKLNV